MKKVTVPLWLSEMELADLGRGIVVDKIRKPVKKTYRFSIRIGEPTSKKDFSVNESRRKYKYTDIVLSKWEFRQIKKGKQVIKEYLLSRTWLVILLMKGDGRQGRFMWERERR